MDLVSIIVPIYNSEDYISRCLDSLINQTYKNIEIVLIDDGSTDGSLNKLNLYSVKDIRVKVFKKENGGASSARNYGLEKSTGKYILFVDIDDYVEISMVEDMIDKIQLNENCMVLSNNDEIYRDKIEYRNLFPHIEKKLILNKTMVMREIASGNAGLVCCKLIPKYIIDKFNIRFDENIKLSEDQLFFLNVCQYIECFEHVEKYLYHYDRRNDNSMTIKYEDKAYENHIYVFNKIEGIFKQNKMDSLEDIKLLSNRIKSSLWTCINNEIQTMNRTNALNRCRKVKKVFLQSNISEKYKKYMTNSSIDKLIITGVNSRNPFFITSLFVLIIKGLMPLKSFVKGKLLRRSYE